MKKNGPLPLDCGGDSWQGWTFCRYGRAREWRLISPAGTTYTAGELDALPGLLADVDYLRGRVRELEAERDGHAQHFTPAELQTLRSAAAILTRLPGLPRLHQQIRHKPASGSGGDLQKQLFDFRAQKSLPVRPAGSGSSSPGPSPAAASASRHFWV